jgi:hypothetical protein
VSHAPAFAGLHFLGSSNVLQSLSERYEFTVFILPLIRFRESLHVQTKFTQRLDEYRFLHITPQHTFHKAGGIARQVKAYHAPRQTQQLFC